MNNLRHKSAIPEYNLDRKKMAIEKSQDAVGENYFIGSSDERLPASCCKAWRNDTCLG
jgi:hypothetical protein